MQNSKLRGFSPFSHFLNLYPPISREIANSFSFLSSKQRIFVSEVLPAVGLPEAHDAGGIQPPGLGGAAGGDAEAERGVGHAVDDDPLVAGAVVGPAADVGLDDVAAVQEGHLAVGLDPDLVPRVLGQDGQRRDVQPELARLGELACCRSLVSAS